MNIAEVFKDRTELDVAQRILDAVPDEIGKPPYVDARLSGIVPNAYSDQVAKLPRERRKQFEERMMDYCKRHQIIERLEQAGLIASPASYLGNPLWAKVKTEESAD
ncbi:hypothetical protein KY325_00235 [Candidatus Woesearchaeota archaeon]|nr:hypothetical protein [Candidatus Woesearchaeota archaeon]MBW3017574.1 hypothetical protein [Candidatus Woesearchaeota archaeon]